MQWQELISCLVAIGVYRRLVLTFCLIYGAISIQRIQRSLGNTSHTSPSFRLGFSLSLSRQAISLRGLTERSLAHLISQSALAFTVLKIALIRAKGFDILAGVVLYGSPTSRLPRSLIAFAIKIPSSLSLSYVEQSSIHTGNASESAF